VQRPAADDQERTEHKEADVPRHRAAEVVAYVVHAQQLVVDETLDQVEETPSGQHQAEVEAPARREAALAPLHQREHRGRHHEQPGRDVEEPVGQRVHLEPGQGRHRVPRRVTDHVVPLQDLVQHDAVHEAAQAEPVEHAGRARGHARGGRCGGHAESLPRDGVVMQGPSRPQARVDQCAVRARSAQA
jgi:hypothetical protein